MRVSLSIGLLLLLYSADLISQTYFIHHNNHSVVSKYSQQFESPDIRINDKNAEMLTDTVVKSKDMFSRIRFGIQVGTAIPAGEYADKGEQGGLAEFGYSAGMKFFFNAGFLFIADFTITSNPFEATYSSSGALKKDYYRSYWYLFGIGMPILLSSDVMIIGSLHVGSVLSKRAEILFNLDRDKLYRQCPQEVISLCYGINLEFLMIDHYPVGLKCLYAKSEHVAGDSRCLRPAIMNICGYVGYLF
jgi:hypothetical protein